MIVQTYSCNECEVVKQKTNHWVIGVFDGFGITFSPWDEDTAAQKGAIHICGQNCAAKVLSKAIEGWSKP